MNHAQKAVTEFVEHLIDLGVGDELDGVDVAALCDETIVPWGFFDEDRIPPAYYLQFCAAAVATMMSDYMLSEVNFAWCSDEFVYLADAKTGYVVTFPNPYHAF